MTHKRLGEILTKQRLLLRLSRLSLVLAALALLAVVDGFPAKWAVIVFLAILDFATVAWIGNKRETGKRSRLTSKNSIHGALNTRSLNPAFG